jgi:hypothetical protein
VLRLNPLVAPIKVTVFPLISNERLVARTQRIATDLTSAGIFNKARSKAWLAPAFVGSLLVPDVGVPAGGHHGRVHRQAVRTH